MRIRTNHGWRNIRSYKTEVPGLHVTYVLGDNKWTLTHTQSGKSIGLRHFGLLRDLKAAVAQHANESPDWTLSESAMYADGKAYSTWIATVTRTLSE